MKLTPSQLIKGSARAVLVLYHQLAELLRDVVLAGGRKIAAWLLGSKRARYGLAVTRILLGVSGLGLLINNFSATLYGTGSGRINRPAASGSGLSDPWLFRSFSESLSDPAVFSLFYLLLMLLAGLLILGWRSRLVLPLYFVLWSSIVETRTVFHDQDPDLYRFALLLLIFADPSGRISLDALRRVNGLRTNLALAANNLWPLRRKSRGSLINPQLSNLSHNLVLIILTAQICFRYFSNGLHLASDHNWAGGLAGYIPLLTDPLGPWPELGSLVFVWAPVASAAIWAAAVLQLAFPFMLLARPTRGAALIGILAFHLGIALLLGVPWFSLSMIAVNAIFIRDRTWQFLRQRIRTTFHESFDQVRNPSR